MEKPLLTEIWDDGIVDIAINDPKRLIEKWFWIVDKKGRRVPFVFNEMQDEFYYGHTSRDDILKARKEGFSSLILAIWTIKFLFVPNVWCVCISHEDEATRRLFSKVEYFIDNLPFKVPLTGRSQKSLKFKDRNSEFYIGTAGSRAFGRGDTINYLHMSEVAFWNPKTDVTTGLLNAVPDDLETTWIVKESTANGYGTRHQIAWEAEKRGESTFKPHFFGWNKDRGHVKPAEGITFTDDELRLAAQYDLSNEQLAWRRWKISSMDATQSHTKLEMFMQEFPINDREAFLSSGRPVFDPKALDWLEQVCVIDPIKVGNLEGWEHPIFSDHSLGFIKVWREPEDGRHYVIGGDVAETGDLSYLCVLDVRTLEQVAEWVGNKDEYEYAGDAYRLGMWYNRALIGIERNNMGVAVVQKLDELGYKNQYIRETIDEITNRTHNELGWRTDSKTRPIMISDLNNLVADRRIKIHSKICVDQMRSFVRGRSNRPEAQSGTHDDCVIGTGIAYQMVKSSQDFIETEEIITRDYVPSSSLNNLYNN
jgi:hypothetical protein